MLLVVVVVIPTVVVAAAPSIVVVVIVVFVIFVPVDVVVVADCSVDFNSGVSLLTVETRKEEASNRGKRSECKRTDSA